MNHGTPLPIDPAKIFSVSHDLRLIAEAMLPPGPREPVTAAQVRQVIRARRERDKHFDGSLFADPAWDMLLDLYAARLEQRRVSVSSLCTAAAVPPTTALRWITVLEKEALVVRSADPVDTRRVFVSISDAAAGWMSDYFTVVQRSRELAV